MFEQYDRDELYQKVWEKPMLRVAEEYGVSSVALGKTCRKLSIPIPGRGHWAKLAHGHAGVKKPPLPKLDRVPIIHRPPVDQRRPPSTERNDAELVGIDELLSSGKLNPQPLDDSARPHALIRHTASLLRSRSRKDEDSILLPREQGGLDVKVSEGTLERALQVLSQVISVLERQGFEVEVTEQGGTAALINGQKIFFSIDEPIRQVVTQKPRVPNPTDRWDYDEIVNYEPAGKLSLRIQSGLWGQREPRKRWSDAKVQRLESCVPAFVAGLMRFAIIQRRQEEKRKRDEAEQQKRERQRAKLQKDIEEEEEKLKQFNSWVDQWERAQRLRRFIAAYAKKTASWAPEKQPKYRAWVEWANQQADRIDPFVSEKPPSVLDQKGELRRW